MANYIGYADKEGIEQVDWSAITTDLIDGIKKEDERRVKKKGEIQKASDDLITEISDHQEALGSDTTYNGYVLDAAQQAKEFALMQNRLMKKGNLKPSEVVRSTQILSDDWKNFEKISKTFQETDAAARKAQESGTLSKQGELSYANFLKEVDINNSRLVVGPKDGRLYFQSKNGKLMDMATVNNRVADLPKDFDILKATTGFTETLGKIVGRDGKGGTIENIRNLDSFKKSKKSYIDSVNADPRNTLSVLTQSGYDVTEDPTKVNANTILLKPDENGLLQPELSEANITAAENELQEYIDSQLDKIYSAENITGSGNANNETTIGQQYGYLANVFNPNEGMRNESINQLLQNFPNVQDITVNGTGVTITKNDGTSPAIPINFIRSGEGATTIYNTAEQMADQLISALTGVTNAEKLKKYKAQFKKTGEYQAMKDNFDKALTAESILKIESSTSRPGKEFKWSSDSIAAINENYKNLGENMVEGMGPSVQNAFNSFLQDGKTPGTKNSRVEFTPNKSDKNNGTLFLVMNGKKTEIGIIDKKGGTTTDSGTVMSTIQQLLKTTTTANVG